MRGEKVGEDTPPGTYIGSPPRARGEVISVCICVPPIGITPACAGRSGLGGVADGLSEDHPRVRGEKKISCS